MSKPVNLQQLRDWLNANEHRTWNHRAYMGIGGGKKKTFEIKYLHFTLDTRDGKIFQLSGRGLSGEFAIDFRDDEKEWTLLEALEERLRA